jgi:hypothetical protein
MTMNRDRALVLLESLATSERDLHHSLIARDAEAIADALDAAEARAFEAGRAAERRDVVKHMRVAPRARDILIHINSSQDAARLAADIESGAHLPAKEKSE